MEFSSTALEYVQMFRFVCYILCRHITFVWSGQLSPICVCVIEIIFNVQSMCCFVCSVFFCEVGNDSIFAQ